MPYNEVKRPTSPDAIKQLFQQIAERHGRRHELVICERIDIGPFTPRGWVQRGVPEEHWPLMAELAGVTVEHVASLHRRIERKSKYDPFPTPL